MPYSEASRYLDDRGESQKRAIANISYVFVIPPDMSLNAHFSMRAKKLSGSAAVRPGTASRRGRLDPSPEVETRRDRICGGDN